MVGRKRAWREVEESSGIERARRKQGEVRCGRESMKGERWRKEYGDAERGRNVRKGEEEALAFGGKRRLIDINGDGGRCDKSW